MNKKILVLFFVFAVQLPVFAGSYLDKQLKEAKKNNKYQTIQKHTETYSFDTKSAFELKDPGLIKLTDYEPVNEAAYKTKISQDEAIYKNKIVPSLNKNIGTINVQPAPVDFYNVYRVAERIIRANNLDYMNWRIAIRKSEESFNASATEGNLIYINTALYDTLYKNDDALAFIIGHEMAHHILGHHQRLQELSYRLNRIARTINDDPLSSSAGTVSAVVQQKRLLAECRSMEFMADALGAELMTRAGYNMNKGIDAMNFMAALPHVKTLSDTHPQPEKRIAAMRETVVTFTPEWVNEGKVNIMNSTVLDCKKSSDRVSIVISKSSNPKKFYEPEPVNKKLLRFAYTNYKNCNMTEAIKYFNKSAEVTNNFIPYLYISYANEYLYKQSRDAKYLKDAQKAIQKAAALNSSDKNVKDQLAAISAL